MPSRPNPFMTSSATSRLSFFRQTSWIFGQIAEASLRHGWSAASTYAWIFLCATVVEAAGVALYALSPRPTTA